MKCPSLEEKEGKKRGLETWAKCLEKALACTPRMSASQGRGFVLSALLTTVSPATKIVPDT